MQNVDPAVGWDDPDYTRPPATRRREPGRWLPAMYVAVTVAVSLVYLWSISVPGVRFLLWLPSLWLLAAIAVAWMVMATIAVTRLLRGSRQRVGWHLVAVPLIGLVVVAARVTDAPLRVRFEPARAEFTEFAEQALADAEGVPFGDAESMRISDPAFNLINPDVPLAIGGFRLSGARVVPEGVVIFERNGAFLDDAGFAYLPDGEFPAGDGSFESPSFRSLGGDWYAFTSSW